MKRIKRWWGKHWGVAIAVGSCTIVLALLMLFRLSSLTGGLSSSEVHMQLASSSWHNLIGNPLSLPLSALQWLVLTLFSHHGQTVTRLPSVVFGLLSLWSLAYILRRWYGVRTAALGTVLFVFSGWFLHAARLASIDILLIFGVLAVMVLHILLERANRAFTAFVILATTALLLYIPGFVWLLAVMYFWQWRRVGNMWQLLPRWWGKTLGILMVVSLLALLGRAFWRHHELVRTWLGAPEHFAGPLTILHHFGNVFTYLFYHGPNTPMIWLVGLPILDIFTLAMTGLGVYFYARHWRAPRARLLASVLLIGAILAALGGPVTESIVIPVVYLFAAAGVAYLLHEWLQVFPFNPLARGIGITMLGIAVAVVCLYNVREYFVAWPHNTDTMSTFENRR
jgi:hypothetical protein